MGIDQIFDLMASEKKYSKPIKIIRTKHKILKVADLMNVNELKIFDTSDWKGTQRLEIYLRQLIPKKKYCKREYGGKIYLIRLA